MQILLGVTGGIAAYKAAGLIRSLTETGHSVKVVATQNSLRFIGAATLEALSHNSVDSDLWTEIDSVKHLELAQSAELIIVAPATASFIARFAAGLADDLLGNILLATKAPIVLAPAMHTEMWTNAATVSNIETLSGRGVRILTPASGRLTGADSGIGRLPEVTEIIDFSLASVMKQDLVGKKFLITAGGTQEPIDPVRYIGNRSSGKQGIAIAKAAVSRGAEVKLIAANIHNIPEILHDYVKVQTAKELQEQVELHYDWFDCLVMSAAVADYSLVNTLEGKIKSNSVVSELVLTLSKTEDILAEAVTALNRKGSKAITVGFAAETDSNNLEMLAHDKKARKGCQILVANDVSQGQVFGSENNSVLILSSNNTVIKSTGTKSEVAQAVLDAISDMLDT